MTTDKNKITADLRESDSDDTVALDSVLERVLPYSELGNACSVILSRLNSNALISEKLDRAVSSITDAVTECSFYDNNIIVRTEDILNTSIIKLTIMSGNMYYRKVFYFSKCTGILEEILKDSEEEPSSDGSLSFCVEDEILRISQSESVRPDLHILFVKK